MNIPQKKTTITVCGHQVTLCCVDAECPEVAPANWPETAEEIEARAEFSQPHSLAL